MRLENLPQKLSWIFKEHFNQTNHLSNINTQMVLVRIFVSLLIFLGIVFIVGCQAQSIGTGLPLSTTQPILPTQGDIAQMTPSVPTPVNSGLQALIEKAKEDLARRLSISINQINLMDATAVTWPDASLGCPQEGMAYSQVLTSGYLIMLEANGKRYEYHASRGTNIIYCENPTPPVLGTPGDI